MVKLRVQDKTMQKCTIAGEVVHFVDGESTSIISRKVLEYAKSSELFEIIKK